MDADTEITRGDAAATIPEDYAGRGRRTRKMATLTSKERDALPASAFAIPEKRAYPIHNESHARDALARVSANGSPEEKAKVRAAVKRRYPSMDVGSAADDAKKRDAAEDRKRGVKEGSAADKRMDRKAGVDDEDEKPKMTVRGYGIVAKGIRKP